MMRQEAAAPDPRRCPVMPLQPFSSDFPFLWFDEPRFTGPEDVLVLGVLVAPAEEQPTAEPEPEAAMILHAAPAETAPPAPETPAEPVVVIASTPAAETGARPTDAAPTAPETPAEPAVAIAGTPAAETEATPPPAEPDAAQPAFAVPDEASFPTLAELDAILAANAGAPATPTAEERAEVIALLGLDPAIAEDPALYAETLANLPDPDADAALEQWLAEYGVEATTPDPAGAWSLG